MLSRAGLERRAVATRLLPRSTTALVFQLVRRRRLLCYNFSSRKIMHLFVASLLLVLASSAYARQAPLPVPPAPPIAAKAYLLVDFNTGKQLAAHDPEMRVEPASLVLGVGCEAHGRTWETGQLDRCAPARRLSSSCSSEF